MYDANGKKQKPKPLPENAYDRVKAVDGCFLHKTPNSVLVVTASDPIGFFFGGSASFSEKATAQVSSGGSRLNLSASSNYQSFGIPSPGTIFNIHPNAFSGSARDTGSVRFIYHSALSTGGR